MDVHAINKNIASLTKQKAFQAAYDLYQSLVAEGKANQFTYSNILNACVQCDNLILAEEIHKSLKKDSLTKRYYYNVIIYTTMMKGYCQSLQVYKAMLLVEEIIRFFIQSSSEPTSKTSQDPDYYKPNIRTFNTLLRGCIHVGNVSLAEDIYSNRLKIFNITADQSTYEYMILLQCQNLHIDKVLVNLGQYKLTDRLKAYMYTARAATILAEKKIALKYMNLTENELVKARELLANQQNAEDITEEIDDEEEGDEIVLDKLTVQKKVVVGGKRPWKAINQESELSVDNQRNLSLYLYRDHLYKEMEVELQMMTAYIDRLLSDQTSDQQANTFRQLLIYYTNFLPLSTDLLLLADHHNDVSDSNTYRAYNLNLAGKDKHKKKNDKNKKDKKKAAALDIKESPVDVLCKYINAHMQDNYGIATLVRKYVKKTVPQLLSEVRFGQVDPAVQLTEHSLCQSIVDLQHKYKACFVENADKSVVQFDLAAMYQRNKVNDQTPRKMKLEICAGSGEWACAQAEHDPENDWMTMEIRQDRVYNTFCRMYMQKIANLRTVAGDAKVILPRFFPDCTVDIVFINYPEPPQQHNDKEDSEAKHLLNKEFFKEIYRILQPNGQLIILTDNNWYGKLLLRTLSDYYSQHFACVNVPSVKGAGDSGWAVNHELRNMKLYEGDPGPAAGHNTLASSYFDRLWVRSSNPERYFITVRKIATKIPINLDKVLVRIATDFTIKGQVPPQNKKIVFTEDIEESYDDKAVNEISQTESEQIPISQEKKEKKRKHEAEVLTHDEHGKTNESRSKKNKEKKEKKSKNT